VIDHDHFTGEVRGIAHKQCNLNYNLAKFKIPVFFHNLKGYDGHIIVDAYMKYQRTKKISTIAQSTEKYLSFQISTLRFVDSYAFMSDSLDRLASFLTPTSFHHLSKYFNDKTELLKRKGVYPYEYMTTFEKFNERSLPPIEAFYSKLTEKHVAQKDYEYSHRVWTEMKINTMGEWHDLYLKIDVLLLADIFENLRQTCYQYYKLDPACYLTAPSLAWDAMLKMTGVVLDNFVDYDMYLLIENNIRGGMRSVGAARYRDANNKYLPSFNPDEPSTYLSYLDANNLYGYVMSKPMPEGGYKWENPKKFTPKWFSNFDFNKSDRGYLFLVDLIYPEELHDLHDGYPLAPESMMPEPSPYMKQVAEEIQHKILKCRKLTLTLRDKSDYLVHGALLQLYLDLGVKIKEIKKVISFRQSTWLKKYTDLNSKIRQ
jgi:hypothetical protein